MSEDTREVATGKDEGGTVDGERGGSKGPHTGLRSGNDGKPEVGLAHEGLTWWKPKKGARPRLRGMGITTNIATILFEVIMTHQERISKGNMILMMRGVKHADQENVRQGGVRLKEVKSMPRAELAPIRGIRPEGATAEKK